MLEVNGFIKITEQDVFAEGCLPETGSVYHDNVLRFKAATIDDLVKALMEFTGCNDRESVLLDACDDQGRIDIQIMETEEGYAASKNDIAQWREGNRCLWLAIYTFQVEQVERKTISLAA